MYLSPYTSEMLRNMSRKQPGIFKYFPSSVISTRVFFCVIFTQYQSGNGVFSDTYDDDDDDIPGFTAHFPSDITLEQAVSTWKLIVEYQNTVEGFKLM